MLLFLLILIILFGGFGFNRYSQNGSPVVFDTNTILLIAIFVFLLGGFGLFRFAY